MLHPTLDRGRFTAVGADPCAGFIAIVPILLRLSVAAVCLAGIGVGLFADSPKAASVSVGLVESLAEEFMKGFRAMDDDQDGKVDVGVMIQTLKAVGYG